MMNILPSSFSGTAYYYISLDGFICLFITRPQALEAIKLLCESGIKIQRAQMRLRISVPGNNISLIYLCI